MELNYYITNEEEVFIKRIPDLERLIFDQRTSNDSLCRHFLFQLKIVEYLHQVFEDLEDVEAEVDQFDFKNCFNQSNDDLRIVNGLLKKAIYHRNEVKWELGVSLNWFKIIQPSVGHNPPLYEESNDVYGCDLFSFEDQYQIVCSQFFFSQEKWTELIWNQIRRTNPLESQKVIAQLKFLSNMGSRLSGNDNIINYRSLIRIDQGAGFTIDPDLFSDLELAIKHQIGKHYSLPNEGKLKLTNEKNQIGIKNLIRVILLKAYNRVEYKLEKSMEEEFDNILDSFIDNMLYKEFYNYQKEPLFSRNDLLTPFNFKKEVGARIIRLFAVLDSDFNCFEYSKMKQQPKSVLDINSLAIRKFMENHVYLPGTSDKQTRTILERDIDDFSKAEATDLTTLYEKIGLKKREIAQILANNSILNKELIQNLIRQ